MHTLSVWQATRDKIDGEGSAHEATAQTRHRLESGARSALFLGGEATLALASYAAAVVTVAQTRSNSWAIEVLSETVGLVLVVRLITALWARLHRLWPRYANVLDLIPIVKAVSAGSLLLWIFSWWIFRSLAIPSAVFPVDAAFLVLLWSGLHFRHRIARASRAAQRTGKPVVIVGVGDAGITVLKELTLHQEASCRAVAIVDDDPAKWGHSVCGVRVEGGTASLAKIVVQTGAAEILICVPSATHTQMHTILEACRMSRVPVRMLPSIAELIDGKASRLNLRRPRVEDLLQRQKIEIDMQETRKLVAGRTILVTGAGGSIGSELCRQISAAGPGRLLLLDKTENNLFYVHLEASDRLGAQRVRPLLVDLARLQQVRDALKDERPEIVFHAAAHKHVGLLEMYPQEAIRNNVIGTRNIAQVALERGVVRFVNVSTDKAVNPKNYMGLSKKLTELCIQELATRGGARFCNVRFGNVAGSTGSVLRLFWDQIQKGGPIRVTDPRATRYFMSVPEAVHLILRACALGAGGETFVFDMGAPLNIYELAQTMMLFAGMRPDKDVPIEFTGLKTGEKVNEELWEAWEQPVPTDCDRILKIRSESAAATGTLAKIRQMEAFLAREDPAGLIGFLDEIMPEFHGHANCDSLPKETARHLSMAKSAGAA